jgi:hypothetical protein
MKRSDQERSPTEVEELTAAIRDMATRVSATFVPDEQKTQGFIAAGESREKSKSAD